MTLALKFGATSTLNYNSGTYGSPVWVPVPICQDVDLDETFEKGDASSRGNGGIKASEPTLLGIMLEFTILEDAGAASYTYLRAAFFAKTAIDIMCSTGAATDSSQPSSPCSRSSAGKRANR